MTKLDLIGTSIQALAGLAAELFDDEDIQANALLIDLRDGSSALKNIAERDANPLGNE